jgi:eukaryotic-like serine/threonine-protein kinase
VPFGREVDPTRRSRLHVVPPLSVAAARGGAPSALGPADVDTEVQEVTAQQAPDRPSRATLTEMDTLLVGKYRLVAPIASGGMGQVWLALHERLGRRVAIKVLRRDRDGDPHHRERFRHEALTVGQLRHPGIVQPIDFGTLEDGRDFLAMEYVEGDSLDQVLCQRGPLPWPVALKVALDVSDALAFAHAHGIVHRDLKAANLMLQGDSDHEMRARILDLGIAHNAALRTDRSLTARGVVLGTPSHSAPEQLRGDEVGPASDLYSLGVVLYRMITGALPYPGSSFAEVAERQRAGPPVPLRELRADPTRPRALDALVLSLLRYLPEERPPSALAVREALRALGRAHAAPTGLSDGGAPRASSSVRAFLFGAAGAVTGVALAGTVWWAFQAFLLR